MVTPLYRLSIIIAGFSLLTAESLTAQVASNKPSGDPIARIRDEGLNRSQVMDILTHLTDVIGPRLTASPGHKRANEWTRDKLVSWGLTNAQLEPVPFGRGWSIKRFSAQVVEPQAIPLAAFPLAWTCGTESPVTADVVYLDTKSPADLEKFKGKLKGAVVLVSPPREARTRFEPLATRLTDSDLLRMANAVSGGRPVYTWQGGETNRPTAGPPPRADGTNRPAGSPPPRSPRFSGGYERIPFAAKEGAAVIVMCSPKGDGGTLLAGSAMVFSDGPDSSGRRGGTFRSPWATNAPAGSAQIALAMEDYNRLVRMIERGEKLKMAVDLQVEFQTQDLSSYNTIAEIPGSDRKGELVMLGGHLDSWHVGTGATDDAAGVAVCMEAVRILKTLNLEPMRTIRIALWTGEEQGYLGSRAHVNAHFGYYTNLTEEPATRSPKDESQQPPNRSSSPRTTRKLIKHGSYDKLAGYFNLDNGAGKIRGVYMQGNEAVRAPFRAWLEPFRDLGAETLTIANTGGTDHIPFNDIGLPGFQFIQDPLDYMARTHHTTADVSDRIPAEDLKQAATIMAAFVYNAAMAYDKLPRKQQ